MTDVLIIPYEENNPYQDNLTNSLENQGVTVHQSSLRPDRLLSKLLSTPEISIIHIHWTYPFFDSDSAIKAIAKSLISNLLFLLLRAVGYRFVWTAHNLTAHDSDHETIEIAIKKAFAGYICETVIAHNHSAAEELRERLKLGCKTNIEVIRHGNYIDTYPNKTSRSASRAELGYEPEEIVYLFFGQIKEYKQVPHLIQSFKEISSEDDKKRLLIAGNPAHGQLEDEIRAKAGDRSDIQTVLEFIPSEKVDLYMNAADIVVLPYSDIFTSGSAILAMSFGNPLIVPSLDTLKETLDSKGAIFYIPDTDLPEVLVEAENHNLTRMGKHNLDLVSQRSWDGIAKNTREVYSTLS